MEGVEDGYWKQVKFKELDEFILACMGMYVEVIVEDYFVILGEMIELMMEVINCLLVNVQFKVVIYELVMADIMLAFELENNQQYEFYKKLELFDDMSYINLYWFNEEGFLGMYKVEDQ